MSKKAINWTIVALLAVSVAALFITTPTECTKSGSVPKYCMD